MVSWGQFRTALNLLSSMETSSGLMLKPRKEIEVWWNLHFSALAYSWCSMRCIRTALYNQSLVQHFPENVIYERLEPRRTVIQSERHIKIFIVPATGWKDCSIHLLPGCEWNCKRRGAQAWYNIWLLLVLLKLMGPGVVDTLRVISFKPW